MKNCAMKLRSDWVPLYSFDLGAPSRCLGVEAGSIGLLGAFTALSLSLQLVSKSETIG